MNGHCYHCDSTEHDTATCARRIMEEREAKAPEERERAARKRLGEWLASGVLSTWDIFYPGSSKPERTVVLYDISSGERVEVGAGSGRDLAEAIEAALSRVRSP